MFGAWVALAVGLLAGLAALVATDIPSYSPAADKPWTAFAAICLLLAPPVTGLLAAAAAVFRDLFRR